MSKVAAAAGVAALVSLLFAPAIGALAASPSHSSLTTTSMGVAADPGTTCKPDKNGDHPNNDNDKKKCPPPVVPEAPLAALLPLSAGAVLGGAYLVMRLRGGNREAA